MSRGGGLGAGSGAIDVAAGAKHSCAVLSSGRRRVLYWGNNRYGQLGDGGAGIRPSPVRLVSGSDT